jgi:hypothetical protein
MDFPIYNLQINEVEQDDAEVSFIALVDQPAIKRDFLAFKEDIKFEVVSEDERIITGPLMIPEQLIYRNSQKFGEHYVKFSNEVIKQIAIKFSKKGYQKNVNIMHDEGMQVDGLTMFESFISNEKRGVKPMAAFSDLPDGTWFGSFYVENPDVWKLVKEGKVKGFSVEGLFDYEKPQSKEEAAMSELKRILNSF